MSTPVAGRLVGASKGKNEGWCVWKLKYTELCTRRGVPDAWCVQNMTRRVGRGGANEDRLYMNSQTRRVPPPISNYLCVETHNYDERRVGLERPPRASFARWSARRRPAPSVVTYDWRSDSFDLVACLATLDRRRVCTAWANRSS